MADPSVSRLYDSNGNPQAELPVQLERLGFFTIDKDSFGLANNTTENNGKNGSKIVLNLTVSLKDSKPKEANAPSKSRKEEQAKQLAEKMAKMNLNPKVIYTVLTQY